MKNYGIIFQASPIRIQTADLTEEGIKQSTDGLKDSKK